MFRLVLKLCHWMLIVGLTSVLLLLGLGVFFTTPSSWGKHLLSIVSDDSSSTALADEAAPAAAVLEHVPATDGLQLKTLFSLTVWMGMGLGLPWLFAGGIARLMSQPAGPGLATAISGYLLVLCGTAFIGWLPNLPASQGYWILGVGTLFFLIYLEFVSRRIQYWS